MTAEPEQGCIRQVLVHPEIWPDLEAWLAARGVELVHLPEEGEEIPTYFMTPSDERLARSGDAPADLAPPAGDGRPDRFGDARLNRYWEAVLDVTLEPDFEGAMPSSSSRRIAVAAMRVADEEARGGR